jgi:HJR/Mrr/RecB family endonuclease
MYRGNKKPEKITTYSISNEAPDSSAMMLLSPTKYQISSQEPVEIKISTGGSVYLDFYPRSYSAAENQDLIDVITKIANGEDPNSAESLMVLLDSSRKITEKASGTINAITKTINAVFSDAGVSPQGAYDSTDVKQEKDKRSISDRVKYLEANTKNFIKGGQTFAGLAYLRNEAQLLTYGFGFYKTSHYGQQYLNESPRLTFYPSKLCWYYRRDKWIDHKGIVLNKIMECLLLLITQLSDSRPLISFYSELNEKVHLNLKSDVLSRLVEALVQHNEVAQLEHAVAQLRAREPFHPIIGIAENAVRRSKVFAEIGRGLGSGVASIQEMGGLEFEQFLAGRFREKGFQVTLTKPSGDFGADLVVETPSGTRAAVQAKRFKNKVNLKAVQEVVASVSHYAADFGIVIAASGFFPSAIELAKTNQVELWDEDKLFRFLSGDWAFSMLADS